MSHAEEKKSQAEAGYKEWRLRNTRAERTWSTGSTDGNGMLGSQTWCQMLIVILALERLKQENGCEFETSLDYIVITRPAMAT